MSTQTKMNHIKWADPDHPVINEIRHRWSPYAWSDRPVSSDDLRSLFEAARWAASSYNEQPWRYIVATRDNKQEYDKLLSCLVEGNQAWAKQVPVLALGCIKKTFTKNGKPNRVAVHDLGAASCQLTLEATSRGLNVHQMAGVQLEKAREVYNLPDDFEVVTAIAIGYAGEQDQTTDEQAQRDGNPRPRRPLNEFVFEGQWENSHSLTD